MIGVVFKPKGSMGVDISAPLARRYASGVKTGWVVAWFQVPHSFHFPVAPIPCRFRIRPLTDLGSPDRREVSSPSDRTNAVYL